MTGNEARIIDDQLYLVPLTGHQSCHHLHSSWYIVRFYVEGYARQNLSFVQDCLLEAKLNVHDWEMYQW